MSDEKEQWKAGDVVQLKSGGPIMTVWGNVKDTQRVLCLWFSENSEKPIDGTFLPVMLKRYEEPKPLHPPDMNS